MHTKTSKVRFVFTFICALWGLLSLSVGLAAPLQAVDLEIQQKLIAQSDLNATDLEQGAEFGTSVSIDGDTTIIGAPEKTEGNNFSSGAAYIYVRSGSAWAFQQKLTAQLSDGVSDFEFRADFGYAVDVDGDTVVVGARFKDENGNENAGAAYIYTRSNNTWTLQQKLTAQTINGADLEEGAAFGRAVRVDGDTIAVGAFGKDEGSGDGDGAVYIYTRSNGMWSIQQKLIAQTDIGTPDPEVSAGFGYSLDLSADTVVVGAYRRDGSTAFQGGAAYVYTRSADTWTIQQKLLPQTTNGEDDQDTLSNFGSSVAIDGNTVVVGATGRREGLLAVGAAYVYTRSADTWTIQQRLFAETDSGPDTQDGARFGYTVSVSGETVAIGAPFQDEGGPTDTGVVYVYDRSGMMWSFQKKLTAARTNGGTDLDERSSFGFSVSLDANTVIAGANNKDESGLINTGAAYIYAEEIDPTDVNRDGIVSPSDALYVINRLDPGTDLTADVNGDNVVDNADVQAVIAALGAQ